MGLFVFNFELQWNEDKKEKCKILGVILIVFYVEVNFVIFCRVFLMYV